MNTKADQKYTLCITWYARTFVPIHHTSVINLSGKRQRQLLEKSSNTDNIQYIIVMLVVDIAHSLYFVKLLQSRAQG